MKSLLGKGDKTDFQVRQWGIRRTRKSVVPLNQQAGERGIAVGSSLTRRVFKLPPKSGSSKNHPIRERMRHSHTFCGAKGDYVLPLEDPIIAYINTSLTTFAGTTPVSLKSSPCERTLNRS